VTVVCIPLVIGQTLFRLWTYGDVLCKLTGFMQGTWMFFYFYKAVNSDSKTLVISTYDNTTNSGDTTWRGSDA